MLEGFSPIPLVFPEDRRPKKGLWTDLNLFALADENRIGTPLGKIFVQVEGFANLTLIQLCLGGYKPFLGLLLGNGITIFSEETSPWK